MEREVMEAIYHAFQHWMLCVCLAGLGMIAALLFLAKVAAPAWDAVRRWRSLPCIQRVIVGVCVVGLSYFGATKQAWHVGYDGGIKAGATANVVTNDTVSIHWQRDTSGGVYVPETATVYIDAIEHGSSNVVNIAQTTVGAWGWSGTVENATNYDYTAWAYYIPPEPVHTNGVWTYKTHFDRNGEYALPLRARVEVNGVAIATPAEKRKDAEKLPYDAELKWLQTDGNAYINGRLPRTVADASWGSIKFSLPLGNLGSDQRLFTLVDNSRNRILFVGNGWKGEYYAVAGGIACVPNYYFNMWRVSGLSRETTHTVQFSGDALLLDGIAPHSEQSSGWVANNISNATSFELFRGANGAASTSPHRFEGFDIADANGKALDIIPVRVGTVGYIYDRVSERLFGNSGTGAFVLGPDK